MYKLKAKDSIFTIPKENLIPFALYEMSQRGLIFSGIDSNEVAITFLRGIGIEVEDIGKSEELTEVPKVPQWNNRQHRDLYNKLFYQEMDRPLTEEENEFCKTMYHMEEYACGLDG